MSTMTSFCRWSTRRNNNHSTMTEVYQRVQCSVDEICSTPSTETQPCSLLSNATPQVVNTSIAAQKTRIGHHGLHCCSLGITSPIFSLSLERSLFNIQQRDGTSKVLDNNNIVLRLPLGFRLQLSTTVGSIHIYRIVCDSS